MEPKSFTALRAPERILLGPGPSNMPASVSQALAIPVIGHLDPAFLQIMDEVQEMLRYTFQTRNKLTIPVEWRQPWLILLSQVTAC